MSVSPETVTVSPEMNKECRALVIQIERRYGSPMFRKMFGDSEAYIKDCALGFIRSGIDASCVLNIRSWLLQGLKPFAEYPPNLEMLIQIGRILKICPFTGLQAQLKEFWYKLDAYFSQGYGRFWRSPEGTIGDLQRERLWLTEFESMNTGPEELEQALDMIRQSTVFRSYPPSLEQFKGAILALRRSRAPLVEEAWLLAMSVRPGQPLHPLIIKARSKISAFDLNNYGKSRENQERFKEAYLSLLKSHDEDDDPVVVDKFLQAQPEYASTSDLLDALKGIGRK
jgi:hypothetical protein